MLSRPDARVVRRDPALPALRSILDPEALAAWLRAGPTPLPVREVTCDYLRYKPGVRALAGYRLILDDGSALRAHAWAIRAADLHKIDKALARPAKAASWGEDGGRQCAGRTADRPLGLLVQLEPNDRRLPALGEITDDAARAALFRRRMPDVPVPHPARVQLLSYKPERRFVARLAPDPPAEGGVVIRGTTGPRFSRSFRAARAFTSGACFRIPELLGHSRRRRLWVLEWMPGTPLPPETWNAMGADGARALARRIGAALAELHRQPARPLRRRGVRNEARGLGGAARGVAAVLPGETAKAARHLVKLLRRELAPDALPELGEAALHGDLHPEQFLDGPEGLVILDLDRAGFGDPHADLATFAAHAERWSLERRVSEDTAQAMVEGLEAGYRAGDGTLHARSLALHRAAALLRLAPQPFRERTPDWPAVTRALLARAESLAAPTPAGTPS
jgi:aminoglycoside phosphotransferase (APT) family kinase protein